MAAPVPDDVEALKAALASMQAERDAAHADRDLARADAALAIAEAAAAKAERADDQALIAHLKLQIAKLKRERFGTSSERTSRLLDQLELQLEELEASATEDELAAEKAAARATTPVKAFTRNKPSRQPFPEHLPRERVVIEAPRTCACCGGSRLSKLGEDVTETLEVIPRQWKVIQTVREKLSCRDCEAIAQPPAPFHVLPRGFHRIRHYGLLAGSARKASLALARELLDVMPAAEETPIDEPPDPTPLCPCCGGKMTVIEVFARRRLPRAPPSAATPIRVIAS